MTLLLLLSGCVPLTATPPPVPAADDGGVYIAGSTGPWVNGNVSSTGPDWDAQVGILGQWERGEWLLGANGFVGYSQAPIYFTGAPIAASLGFSGRRMWTLHPRLRLGFEFNLGLPYANVSAPISLELTPETWLYTNPGIGLAPWSFGRVPLGLAHETRNGGLVFVEAGMADLMPEFGIFRPHRLYLSVGVRVGG